MRAPGSGGSLGLAAVEVDNATELTKVETTNKLLSGNEETVVGVTRGSDSSHKENLKDVHNRTTVKIFAPRMNSKGFNWLTTSKTGWGKYFEISN